MRTDESPAVAGEAEPSPRSDRERIRAGIRHCVLVFAGVRAGLSILGLLAVAVLPHADPGIASAAGVPEPVGVPGWPAPEIVPGWHNLVTAWERFDALWFLRIATAGYVDGDGSAAFFPLYPLLVRGVSVALGGHPLAAALVVSNLAFLGALLVVYFLTESEIGTASARRTVLYLALFPTAFFFLAPYSESTFLFLAAGSLWGARRGRWGVAGVAGALAAATRNVGMLLALPLAVEAVHRWRERGESPLRPLLWSGGVVLGAAAYLGFWQALAGDPLAPLHQQATWQREGVVPTVTLLEGTREAFRWIGVYPGGYHLLDWLIAVPALAAAVWVTVRARPVFAVYAWTSLLAPLSFTFPLRPFMSLPRFLLPIIPLFWAAAQAGRRRGAHEALTAAFAAGLGLLTVLFVNWYYIF